jgi:DedD protein
VYYMMERALKERIIGASVLVIFVVLIVPVFLDGPSEETENVSEVITLPGQEHGGAGQKTVVLERDREQPVPAARTENREPERKPAAVEKQVIVAKSTPADKKPTPETVADNALPEEESTTGMWAVQMGSFSNQENAEQLAADLRKDGYAAFLSQLQTGNGKLHRVRIGPQKDRVSAESVAAKLSAKGHKGQVVPHP